MLSDPDVLAWRLRRQHLVERAPREDAMRVVGDIGGLHAQVLSSAELTLWARVEGLERGWVEHALWEERSLLKTWAMRGTLHLLATDEAPMWIGAQGALPPRWEKPSWPRGFGVTPEEVAGILAAVPKALGRGPLTRQQLADAVARRLGADHLEERLREGFGALLKPSAFLGDLCFATNEGRNVRFTRPDRWVDGWTPMDREEAADGVTRRYLAAYGPATRDAYDRWLGAGSAAHAGRLIARLGDEVAEVETEAGTAWALAADVGELAEAGPPRGVRLLPAFDQHVVGTPRDADAALAPEHRDRVYRPQGWLSPVLLVDGRFAGVWSHERKGGKVSVEIMPFGRVPAKAKGAAAEEAERLAAFLGGPLELTWTRG